MNVQWGLLILKTHVSEEGRQGHVRRSERRETEGSAHAGNPGFNFLGGPTPWAAVPKLGCISSGSSTDQQIANITAFHALPENFYYSRYSTLEINCAKFYKTMKVMNHESCKGKPNTQKPSTAVLYLLCVHFATRNFVINFHLLFKHICLLDKIGHIS